MIDPSISAGEIGKIKSDVIERSGTWSNEVFPYRFWQSFSLPGWDFEVIFSVDVKNVTGGVELFSDIATSNGVVLAEFERLFIDSTIQAVEKEAAIRGWTTRLQQFLAANASLIVQRLCDNSS